MAQSKLKTTLHEIIFEASTPRGKLFDVLLIIAILVSSIIVMLDSVPGIHEKYQYNLDVIEWFFTGFFTIEYILRIAALAKPKKYILSFFGIIDLISVLPSYIGIFIAGSQAFVIIRVLRLIRIFRIFKLFHYLNEGDNIWKALIQSKARIIVFLVGVLSVATIIGTIMYTIEDASSGFTSIPRGIYWAIVTMTTVGYGDITPQTNLGQFFSSILMIIGYSIIAVPTGIVTAEMTKNKSGENQNINEACPSCGYEGHDNDAVFCKNCGEKLNP